MVNISTAINTIKSYDKTNSILIIGTGESEYKNKEVVKPKTVTEVEYNYGTNSDLTLAFKEALDIGAKNIFLCNCFKFTDYLDVVEIINKEHFDYICPLINFSEKFTINNNNSMYFCEFYSNTLNDNTSQLFFTDKHASLYENLDQYLSDTNKILTSFKSTTFNKLNNGSNLCFILNNLENYKFANIAVASIVSISNFKEYPQLNIGDVVFNINSYDLYGIAAFFDYNSISGTTIENFYNYFSYNSPERFVPVSIIKQKILRSLDFSNYTGKILTPYLRIAIENNFNQIMNKHVGNLIESFALQNISFKENEDRTITIIIYSSFKPYNSMEEINLILEM